jgi:hypothetical protein
VLIHYVSYSSQPYVYISCKKQDAYSGPTETGIDEVYACELESKDDSLYTFNESKVTCEECIKSGFIVFGCKFTTYGP